MTTYQTIETKEAPAAIGPYSQAVEKGGMIFCSGQVGLDPKTGKMVEGGVEAQTHQVMRNLSAVLESAELGFRDVVRMTIFLQNMDDFQLVNQVYSAALGNNRPARATVEVSRLPAQALVEIDAIAIRG